MTAKPTPDALANGRRERGLAEDNRRSETIATADTPRGRYGTWWSRRRMGVAHSAFADVEREIGTSQKARGTNQIVACTESRLESGSVRKRRAAVWAAARLSRSLCFIPNQRTHD